MNAEQRVLIIDSDLKNCKAIKYALTEYGIGAYYTLSVIDGIERLTRHNYELVILDISLSETDGLQLLRFMRQMRNMPILVLSFQGGIEHRARAYEMGADDFIQKPLELQECLLRAQAAYGFDLEPIVMDGIKTKKLVENAEMDYAEMMFEMYGEPETSYGDITRYFTTQGILVYEKTLKRGFLGQLLRNPVYVQADMDIYEYFKAQGVKIESLPELFTGDYGCYLYQGREGEEPILVIAPHKGRIPSGLWLAVQRKLSQNTTFQNGRKCHNTWLAGKIKCGCCGYALASLNSPNGVTYLRCKQRTENKGCQGAGTLTKQVLEQAVYEEMVKKMRVFQTLKGGRTASYNPKLTAARAALAKTESEIEKLLDMLSGANPTLLQYANSRIEELDGQRQTQAKLVADLTANSVSSSQVESISGYLRDWESVDFDDKRRVLDTLVSQVRATSEQVVIHWKL